MTEEQLKNYINVNGYTKLAVEHPNTSKKLVLEILDKSDKNEGLKEYYKEFINSNFQ